MVYFPLPSAFRRRREGLLYREEDQPKSCFCHEKDRETAHGSRV
mgnify:CR=1 FL=1